VIGGLITSTLLTLVIVPAVFTLFDDIERWLAPKAAGLLAGTPAVGQDKPALAREQAKLPAT
jgi:HAE1 family hydrophobic/amphiphilic exporter-1